MAGGLTAEDVIRLLDLVPLPKEGGFFRQTYSATDPAEADRDAPQATAILYLITPASFSALHRLMSDELYHFYLGDPCEMIVCSDTGKLERIVLGPHLRNGQRVQQVVPGGTWQAVRVLGHGQYSLLGTTMTPGFRHDQFQLACLKDFELLEDATASVLRRYLAPLPVNEKDRIG